VPIALPAEPSAAEPPAAEPPAAEPPAAEPPAAEPPAAEPPAGPARDPAAARALADHLLAAGMARQAFVELEREAYAATDPAQAAAWHREAGALLWRAGRWDDAAAHFAALGADPQARLALGYSLARDQRWAPAASVLDRVDLPAAAYLDGFVALERHDPSGALSQWQRVPATDPLGPSAAALVSEVSAWGPVPYRAPALAGVLSAVVPGSGQAYGGRWGEALSALVVNGLLIASGVELGRRDLWFGLGVVCVFEAGFYGGNVMSAVNGARRFNRRAWERRLGPVEGQHGLQLSPGATGWQATTPDPGAAAGGPERRAAEQAPGG